MKIFVRRSASVPQAIIALLLLSLALLTSPGAAAAGMAGRPTIVFFYVDALTAGGPEKGAIRRETVDRFAKKYSPAYSFVSGDAYEREFAISRFTDLSSLDRFDLLPRLTADRVDYAVFYTVLPLRLTRDSMLPLATTTSHVQVRVFDLDKDAYVCDSVFSYTSNWAWLSGHLAKLSADVDSMVFAEYFPLRM